MMRCGMKTVRLYCLSVLFAAAPFSQNVLSAETAGTVQHSSVPAVRLEIMMTQALEGHDAPRALILARRLLKCSSGGVNPMDQNRLFWIREKRTALLAQWLSLPRTARKHQRRALRHRRGLPPSAPYEAAEDPLSWHPLISSMDQDLSVCDINGDRFCDTRDLVEAEDWLGRCLSNGRTAHPMIKRLDFDHDDCVTRNDLFTLLWTAGDWDASHEPVDALCAVEPPPLETFASP